MSIWSQIENDRVSSIPPDGRTSVDIYAQFSFSNAPLPEGALVTFIIGKGSLPVAGETEQRVDREWSLADITGSITPIAGIELISESGERGFECVGIVQNRLVRDGDGSLKVLPVARCSVAPIDDILADEFTIVAYSDFDKTGLIERLQPQEASLTVMSGEGVFLTVAERYDTTTNEWETVEPMQSGRAGPFTESVGGKVYVIGGFNGNFTDVTEEYDPALDEWTTKSPLPLARGFGSSAVVSDKIYVVGGYSFEVGRASEKMHRYDPSTDTWDEMSSP